MPKPKAKPKIETNTARPLKSVKQPVVKKDDPVKDLLDHLYKLAMEENNTTAAKIYLDVVLKQKNEDPDALTPEEALRILQGQATGNTK
jgi:hypothetical protein